MNVEMAFEIHVERWGGWGVMGSEAFFVGEINACDLFMFSVSELLH